MANAQSYPGVFPANTVLAGPLSGSGAPTARALTEADVPILAQSAAYTLLGNATGSSAAITAFTIGSLTNKSTPTVLDLLVIQDQAAGGALKYCTVAQCLSAAVAGVGSINSLSGVLIVANGGGIIVSSSGTTVKISAPVYPPGGRLTLQSHTPVMTSSVSLATTIYYDCYHGGNTVPYFDGTTDQIDTVASCEVSRGTSIFWYWCCKWL